MQRVVFPGQQGIGNGDPIGGNAGGFRHAKEDPGREKRGR
jgi:hypothetical protein